MRWVLGALGFRVRRGADVGEVSFLRYTSACVSCVEWSGPVATVDEVRAWSAEHARMTGHQYFDHDWQAVMVPDRWWS